MVMITDPSAVPSFGPNFNAQHQAQADWFRASILAIREALPEGPTDATPGRLMLNGAHGWGSLEANKYSGDVLDPDIPSGIYYAFDAGGEPAGVSNGYFLAQRFGDGFARREYYAQRPGGGRWENTLHNGVWSGWRRTYETTNVVGPVSQFGGVPTGGLFQSGSNSNGSFERTADGDQVCHHVSPVLTPDAYTAGAMFGSPSWSWTYPAAFVAPPTILATVRRVEGPHGHVATISSGGYTSTGANLVLLAAGTAASTGVIHVEARGRWF
ncbi:hypothetical protein EKE94_03155 [Mesobaculum littorinae]|uniref:Uncharacterized protein n=1 Tax=Mesobaculum littorinae TaxID=2486419 RepID=A0A438AM14_9RHOB|nr:hypothetical protein [Mesobaculum littorinae]RVV99694.1 hypothetical protein EKE94_03155 [Mesobaculum littorinae]